MKNSFDETAGLLYGKIVKVGNGMYEGRYNEVFIMENCLELMESDSSSETNLEQIQAVMDEWGGEDSFFHYRVVPLKKAADLKEPELMSEADHEGANLFVPLFTPRSDHHYFMVAQSLPELLEYDLMNLLVSVEAYTLYKLKCEVISLIGEDEKYGRAFWMHCWKGGNGSGQTDSKTNVSGKAENGGADHADGDAMACRKEESETSFLKAAHDISEGGQNEAMTRFDFFFNQMNKSAMVDFFSAGN